MADLTRGFFIETSNVTRGCLLNGTVSAGDPIGQDGTGWVRAIASAGANVSCQAFAMQDGVSADRITICERGLLQTSTALTQGAMVFLSGTSGRIADADPGAATVSTQVLGYVVGASPSGLIQLDATAFPVVELAWYQNLTTIMVAGQGAGWYVARRNYRVLSGTETHSVAGTNGSAVTLTLAKAAATVAFGSGTNVLTTTFNLKSTADTPVLVAASATAATARLATGDRLACIFTGTLTSLVDTAVTVQLVALER